MSNVAWWRQSTKTARFEALKRRKAVTEAGKEPSLRDIRRPRGPELVYVFGDDWRHKHQPRGLYVDGKLFCEGEVTLDLLARAAGLNFRYHPADGGWLGEVGNLPLELKHVHGGRS